MEHLVWCVGWYCKSLRLLDDNSWLEGLRDGSLRSGAVDRVRHAPWLWPVGRHMFDLQQQNKLVRKSGRQVCLKSLTMCAFCLKALLQTWQTKGFSPVWIFRCCLKLNRLELIRRPQTGQHLSSDLNKNNIYIITLTEGEGRGGGPGGRLRSFISV